MLRHEAGRDDQERVAHSGVPPLLEITRPARRDDVLRRVVPAVEQRDHVVLLKLQAVRAAVRAAPPVRLDQRPPLPGSEVVDGAARDAGDAAPLSYRALLGIGSAVLAA